MFSEVTSLMRDNLQAWLFFSRGQPFVEHLNYVLDTVTAFSHLANDPKSHLDAAALLLRVHHARSSRAVPVLPVRPALSTAPAYAAAPLLHSRPCSSASAPAHPLFLCHLPVVQCSRATRAAPAPVTSHHCAPRLLPRSLSPALHPWSVHAALRCCPRYRSAPACHRSRAPLTPRTSHQCLPRVPLRSCARTAVPPARLAPRLLRSPRPRAAPHATRAGPPPTHSPLLHRPMPVRRPPSPLVRLCPSHSPGPRTPLRAARTPAPALTPAPARSRLRAPASLGAARPPTCRCAHEPRARAWPGLLAQRRCRHGEERGEEKQEGIRMEPRRDVLPVRIRKPSRRRTEREGGMDFPKD
jgi:hypothetical protein